EMVGEVLEGRLATLAAAWHRGPPAPPEGISRDLSIAILRLRLQNFGEQIQELTFLQHEAKENGDMQHARQYTEIVDSYKQERKKLEQIRD
ncbi:hypothetical protein, partial [Enterococcus casseliflavus]|uniref:hypothetical protein n=1 Tax=Enterococcus casseliflavus TaxID=37734 RepID=UPI003D0FEFCF